MDLSRPQSCAKLGGMSDTSAGRDDLRQRLERLRRLGVHRGAHALPARPPAAAANVTPADRPAQASATMLPGAEVNTPHGPAWVCTTRYPLAERRDLAAWLGVTPLALAALDRNEALFELHPGRAAFIDTETTGLSLGAGTYTFLIGVGTYELAPEPAFVVRQYFMRNPAEERGQLHLVDAALADRTGIVSFNGRAFDMPLINNRFLLAGMSPPLVAAPHLDLLPPARRLYRARWGSCSLGNLERQVLGFERTADDVPGSMIPEIYRQYYLAGAGTEMLARVFYHNLQDIVSMALLAVYMARCFDPDSLTPYVSELHPLECLGLGRCYESLNWADACIAAYRAAVERLTEGDERVQAWRELGFVYKRLERRDEAVALWEAWIGTLTGDDLTPYIELAKHHEWHSGDLTAARGWAAWALRIAEGWPAGYLRDETVAELRHRLARIEGKLNGRITDKASGED
jgi:uncharacterized protein